MSAIAIERMKLEGRLSPEDLAMAENNLKGFIRFLFRTQLTADASQAVGAKGVAAPPSLRELK